MGQRSHLLRRSSGVYVVRLAVPGHLRALVGKGELHRTTGTTNLATAKAIAALTLSQWRTDLLALSGVLMDVNRLLAGSPSLQLDGLISLQRASADSGLALADIVDAVLDSGLPVFCRLASVWGHQTAHRASELDLSDFGSDGHPRAPVECEYVCRSGSLRICEGDRAGALTAATAGGWYSVRVLDDPAFVADTAVRADVDTLEVSRSAVEAIRIRYAAAVTPAQRAMARVGARAGSAAPDKRISTYLPRYLKQRSGEVKPDQMRQIQETLELFVQVERDPLTADVNRERLEAYRDDFLPKVPEREEKIRLKRKTSSVLESIEALSGELYTGLSPGSIQKRMGWITAFTEWIKAQKSQTLTGVATAGSAKKKPTKVGAERQPFDAADLSAIFSDGIFRNGKGELTKEGTYQRFLPWHFWGPLIGLFSGMRPNESCQMHVADIVCKEGVWCFSVEASLAEDDEDGKSVKSKSGKRLIPIHSKLLELGLLEWRDAIAAAGHKRLFPEWKAHAKTRLFSAMATRWFNGTFKKRVLPKAGKTKVLYSLRHNFNTALLNKGCPPMLASNLMGHAIDEAGASKQTIHTYNHGPEITQLREVIERLSFDLPPISAFDCTEGSKAIVDAIGRKKAFRPASA